jgi:hypothetical protein
MGMYKSHSVVPRVSKKMPSICERWQLRLGTDKSMTSACL